ncbi:MAG TPA: biopolymer transporter ExbD [Bacillota bacterium]
MKKQPIKLEKLPQAKVEIINLIDVLITLIAFFMLTTVFARQQQQLKVDLPEAQQAQTLDPQIRKILIEVDSEDHLKVNHYPVSLKQLAAVLRQQPAATVAVIQADKACRYEKVIQVLDRVKESKLKRISFEVKSAD